MTRTPMGPPASEPEQRTYVVERVDAQGHVLDHVLVRSFHALEAARAFAEDSGLRGPWHEYAPAPRVWCISNAECVVMASSDPSALLGVPLTLMRTSERPPTNDERAAVQRRIADAIRSVPEDQIREARACLAVASMLHEKGELRQGVDGMPWCLAALAMCAKYPEVLDAVRQVAQVHALEIREDDPSEGG